MFTGILHRWRTCSEHCLCTPPGQGLEVRGKEHHVNIHRLRRKRNNLLTNTSPEKRCHALIKSGIVSVEQEKSESKDKSNFLCKKQDSASAGAMMYGVEKHIEEDLGSKDKTARAR